MEGQGHCQNNDPIGKNEGRNTATSLLPYLIDQTQPNFSYQGSLGKGGTKAKVSGSEQEKNEQSINGQ